MTALLLLLLLLVAASVVAGCAGGSSPARSGGSHAAAGHGAMSSTHAFASLSVPAGAPARTVRVPILTYHRVHDYATELTKSVPDLTVQPDTFEREISALARDGYHSVSQRQLFDALYRGGTLPPKPVLISVDDGYVDDVTQVLPVLERAHMVATFYVVTGRLHEAGFLSAAEIRQLDAAGMDVGAHTRSHAVLPELGASALESEVAGSRSDLEQVLGHPIYWFAYPFGEFTQRVVEAVRSAGFLLAVTTRPGTHESSSQALTMPRLHVSRLAGPATVVGLAGGALAQ